MTQKAQNHSDTMEKDRQATQLRVQKNIEDRLRKLHQEVEEKEVHLEALHQKLRRLAEDILKKGQTTPSETQHDGGDKQS